MARVLVTGSGGFIGSHVVERFVKAGWLVRATDLASADLSQARAAGAEIVHSDLTDPETLRPAVAGCDAVVHAAAIFHFDVAWPVISRVNVEGTTNVCRAASTAGVRRFIEFSSVAVYGKPKAVPCNEQAPKQPRNNYERSKWEGERAAFSFDGVNGMRVSALRPTMVYGPRSKYGHAMYLGVAALMLASGVRRVVTTRGGPMTHNVHVADVAEAAYLLATHPGAVGQAFNVADNTPVPHEEFWRIIYESVGLRGGTRLPYSEIAARTVRWIIKHLPRWVMEKARARTRAGWRRVVEYRGLEPALDVAMDTDWIDYLVGDHVYDTTRIKQLGFEPSYPRFDAGLAETADWYREQQWLPARRREP